MAAEAQTQFSMVRAPIYADRVNITDFLNALSGVATQVANRWWRGEFVDFHDLYEVLEPLEYRHFRQSYKATTGNRRLMIFGQRCIAWPVMSDSAASC